jgi:paired amphipathic helix protein Sin3a
LGFFDKAKKQISNRASYAEFLKLINLFSQDLIDKYTLTDRVMSFIGSSPDLMAWFKDFMNVQEQDDIFEARARVDTGRVNLSHCRALGPSYRHLPKRDQNKTCKGRDGMCYEVLNDVWASHPTWASEDSGFVAHRKNQHEEALHRIEEERHDYDFHIESCQRTIQLMEPIVQQFNVMNENEKKNFQLAPGFGGASESIPKRIIMKVYGRETGGKVLTEMYQKPLSVLPIVLARLKQKLEEWKSTQREWEKVWRDQINKQFWKSLDHQGINIRSADKKAFQQKQLTGDIQNKYEEAKKTRENGNAAKRHHLEYKFDDLDVIVDATRLIMVTLQHDRTDRNGFSANDQERVKAWILDFLPRFFGLNHEEFAEQVKIEVAEASEEQDGNESDGAGPRKNRKGGLIRRVFDKRNGNSDSAPNSKESTPIPTTEHDMDVDEEQPQSDAEDKPKAPWINVTYGDVPADNVSLEESYPHTTFNLYANVNIYCFFRMFEILYSRLLRVKQSETQVVEAVKRHRGTSDRKKPAIELRMIDKGPEYFFQSLVAREPYHYYHEILQQCEDVAQGRSNDGALGPVNALNHLEETLRRYYNKTGWQLYTVDKLLNGLLRYVANILGGDAKDKSVDIANLFFRDRERPDTTRRQEIEYRKQVERMSKDGEVYRISYVSCPSLFWSFADKQTPEDKFCTIRYFPSEDPTFDSDALTDDQLWQYYVASYTMSEATEGVDQSAMNMPYLRRNVAPQSSNIESAYQEVFGNITHFDNQTAFISPDTYKLLLSNDYIWWRHGVKARKTYPESAAKPAENDKFRKMFVRNTKWMENQSQEYVEGIKAEYERQVREGFTVPE